MPFKNKQTNKISFKNDQQQQQKKNEDNYRQHYLFINNSNC